MPIIGCDPKPTADLFYDLDHLALVHRELACGVIPKQAPKIALLPEKGFGHPTASIIGSGCPNELGVVGGMAPAEEKDVALFSGDGIGTGAFVSQDDKDIAGHHKSASLTNSPIEMNSHAARSHPSIETNRSFSFRRGAPAQRY